MQLLFVLLHFFVLWSSTSGEVTDGAATGGEPMLMKRLNDKKSEFDARLPPNVLRVPVYGKRDVPSDARLPPIYLRVPVYGKRDVPSDARVR